MVSNRAQSQRWPHANGHMHTLTETNLCSPVALNSGKLLWKQLLSADTESQTANRDPNFFSFLSMCPDFLPPSHKHFFSFLFLLPRSPQLRPRRVMCHGINGLVQLRCVKQVVKRWPCDTHTTTRARLVRLRAWLSPACLPARPPELLKWNKLSCYFG